MIGGRLKRVRQSIGDGKSCMTYSGGVASIGITALLAFDRAHGRLSSVTAARPPGRSGTLGIAEERISALLGKPCDGNAYINGRFFVLSPKVLDDIEGDDDTVWEQEPMQALARAGQRAALRHDGFWRPTGTLRQEKLVEAL